MEVIEGMTSILKSDRPSVLLEIKKEELAEKINSQILGLSYRLYNINESIGLKEVKKVSKSSSWNFLLLSERHSISDNLLN